MRWGQLVLSVPSWSHTLCEEHHWLLFCSLDCMLALICRDTETSWRPTSFSSNIHPSVHHLYLLSFERCIGGAGANQLTLGTRQHTSWTAHQCIAALTYRDKQPFTLTFTPTLDSESQLIQCLNCMRKLQYLKLTPARGRTCKLQREREHSRPSGDDSANHGSPQTKEQHKSWNPTRSQSSCDIKRHS